MNDTRKAVTEYHNKELNKYYDVAVLENNEVKFIVEILYTHKTETRIEPWVELNATDVLNYQNQNPFFIKCQRNRKCETCYKIDYVLYEIYDICPFLKNGKESDYEQDEECIVCDKIKYYPFYCIRKKRFYPICKSHMDDPILDDIITSHKEKLRNIREKRTKIISLINPLYHKNGSEKSWKQEKICFYCEREKYSPFFSLDKRRFYPICKICMDDDNIEDILIKLKNVEKNSFKQKAKRLLNSKK